MPQSVLCGISGGSADYGDSYECNEDIEMAMRQQTTKNTKAFKEGKKGGKNILANNNFDDIKQPS